MNPIGIKALQDIRKYPGFESTIIAGGMVRDHLMKGDFTDIDLYVPVKNQQQFEDICIQLMDVNKCEFSDINWGSMPTNYGGLRRGSFLKLDCKYREVFDVDIMGYLYSENNFGQKIIDGFNYNIDKCFYDGEQIITTKECDHDIRYGQATLTKCPDPSYLPYSILKFIKLQQKYPNILFITTLEIKERNEDNREEDRYFSKRYKPGTATGTILNTFTNTVEFS